MFNKFNLVKNFLIHLFLAKNEYSLHSPFLFDFYNKTIKSKVDSSHFSTVENIRKELLNNTSLIEVTDFGAGSKVQKSNKRKISTIAKSSLTPQNQCELLFKITNYLEPKTIIELGTSLGISTSYFSKSKKLEKLYTIEGCPAIAKVAQQNFDTLNLKKIEIIVGNIDEQLPELVNKLDSIDVVFFDGNHTKQATLNYFEICLPKITNDTLFIFDDIYWSKEMQRAWEEIHKRTEVKISIDLFDFGLVFFRNNQPKQHFVLRW